MSRLPNVQNLLTNVVHSRDGLAENRWEDAFGISTVILRSCRPTYNMENDPAFVLTDDPVTCKSCKKVHPKIDVRFDL
jgi:hypothetical protein